MNMPYALPMQDHPRIHGEHMLTVFLLKSISGSPPHTRGTQGVVSKETQLSGITPAYTGNTLAEKLEISQS